MKAIIINGNIKTFPSIPSTWNNRLNYHKHAPEVHYADGFRDVVQPSYNTATQTKGAIYFNEDLDVFTYYVIDKTSEQIQNEIRNQAASEQEAVIQERLKAQVLTEAQAVVDVDELLNNQSLYPLWQPDIAVNVGEKYQDFNDTNELVLYEVLQAHTTQADWQPRVVPALFKRVAHENEILPWIQPQGAHDAYQIGDKVTYNNQTWESTHNANIWAPGVFGWIVI